MNVEVGVPFPAVLPSLSVFPSYAQEASVPGLLPELLPALAEKSFSSLEAAAAEWLRPAEHIQNSTGLHLINTRLWLNQLSDKYGERITVGSIPDGEWGDLFEKYDAFWFMGIYQPSEASRHHAMHYPESVSYAKKNLDPEKDIVASPFAIPDYSPNSRIAKDWEEWDQMVAKLHEHGKKVLIDFVANHVALDHPWARQHPEYFIQASHEQKDMQWDMYASITGDDWETYNLAHGKDPNYDYWSDTLQLNYANPSLQQAMAEVLLGNEDHEGLVQHADGVRCDMAMLLNPETFIRTWGDYLSEEETTYLRSNEFWPKTISKVKEKARELGKDDFLFVAEAYWDLDALGQYFDVIYGKSFYDDLVKMYKQEDKSMTPDDLRRHIEYLIDGRRSGKRRYQQALFVENHDEPRAVTIFGIDGSKAAAAITAVIPDNVFLMNQGQEDGLRIRPPMQLDKPIEEEIDPKNPQMKEYYDRLLTLKHTRLFQEGDWSVAHLSMNNPFIIAERVVTPSDGDIHMGAVVCTNFSRNRASCRIPEVGVDKEIEVVSISSGYKIENPDMARVGGLYVELIPWETQVVLFAPSEFAIAA